MALFGHGATSDLSPLSGVKRKLDYGAVRSAFDAVDGAHSAASRCHRVVALEQTTLFDQKDVPPKPQNVLLVDRERTLDPSAILTAQ
jgi:hypothetical protein